MRADPPFSDPKVAARFAGFPDALRPSLMSLRALIYQTASETEGVGPLLETLKWGQPAYLTPKTKSGSTLRLGLPKSGGFALYAHCQTTIISDFRTLFPSDFTFEGNRAVLFEDGAAPDDKLRLMIKSALTYHLHKH